MILSALWGSTLLALAPSCSGCGTPAAPPAESEGEGDAGEGEGEGEPVPMNACIPEASGPGFQISAKADLRWKRATALQNDLIG